MYYFRLWIVFIIEVTKISTPTIENKYKGTNTICQSVTIYCLALKATSSIYIEIIPLIMIKN